MKPGRSVASPRSMTCAPAGIAALEPTAVIFPPVTTINWRNHGIAFTIKEPSCLQDVDLVGRFLSLSHSRRPQHQAEEKAAENLGTHEGLLCSLAGRSEADFIVSPGKVNRRGKRYPDRRIARS